MKTAILVIDRQRDACSCSCSVCVRAGGACWRLDHTVQSPDDSPHTQGAPCTQSPHQPCHTAQPGRGRPHGGNPIELWLRWTLGDRGRGGKRGGGTTTAVTATRRAILRAKQKQPLMPTPAFIIHFSPPCCLIHHASKNKVSMNLSLFI